MSIVIQQIVAILLVLGADATNAQNMTYSFQGTAVGRLQQQNQPDEAISAPIRIWFTAPVSGIQYLEENLSVSALSTAYVSLGDLTGTLDQPVALKFRGPDLEHPTIAVVGSDGREIFQSRCCANLGIWSLDREFARAGNFEISETTIPSSFGAFSLNYGTRLSFEAISAVPEGSTHLMFLAGLFALAPLTRRAWFR